MFSPILLARRKIRLIESNANVVIQNSDLDRDFAAGVCLSEVPFPPRYCLGGGVGI